MMKNRSRQRMTRKKRGKIAQSRLAILFRHAYPVALSCHKVVAQVEHNAFYDENIKKKKEKSTRRPINAREN